MKKSLSFKTYINSQLTPLFIRLGMLLLLYAFFRLLFFLAHADSFPHTTLSIFYYGIKFDLSAILFSNALYITAVLLPFSFCSRRIYRIIFDSYFVIINCFAAAVSYIDTAYYPYVLKRMTCDIFSYLQIGFDFQTLLPSFLKQFWYLVLIFAVTCFVIIYTVKLTNRMITKNLVYQVFSWKDLKYKLPVFVGAVFIFFMGMRGGLQTRPIGLIDTGKDATVKNAAIVSNTPFTLIKSIGKQQSEIEKHYFQSLEDAERHYSPVINNIKPYLFDGYAVKNVVIIILEGFSKYLVNGMELENNEDHYTGYCPFINSLRNQSIYFNGIAHGHRTIEGLPAIFCGLPKLLYKSYMESTFANNYFHSPIEI